MCWFCEKTYKDETEFSNAASDAWHNEEPIDEGLIVGRDGDGFDIIINDFDEHPRVTSIKFCPFCGRKL